MSTPNSFGWKKNYRSIGIAARTDRYTPGPHESRGDPFMSRGERAVEVSRCGVGGGGARTRAVHVHRLLAGYQRRSHDAKSPEPH